jgi:hypothetical protein
MGTVQSFPGIKWPQHESEHSSPFRAEVKFVMCTRTISCETSNSDS